MNYTIAVRSISARVLILLSLLCCAPLSFAAVNYDTAWTFVYDGGKMSNGKAVPDMFFDAVILLDRSSYCVGVTSDSANWRWVFLMKFDPDGKMLWKKRFIRSGSGHSVVLSKNGDLIIGGERGLAPLAVRTDTSGNIKWSSWYYDTVKNENILQQNATINSIRETKRGTIIFAAGDEYPNNGGYALTNYAAFFELNSDGTYRKGAQLDDIAGYNIGGFYIEEGSNGYYLLSGNQAVFYLDTNRTIVWKTNYTFSLKGVGTVTNNVCRVKMLRDGSLMAAGQAYEGNCWTNWQKFYYDAWYSPISYAYGTNTSWDTAGVQRADDIIYDFTQLINGNLVFVGTRGDDNGSSPVWVFVTDSSGKELLMDKKYCIPRPDNTCGNTFPFSVAATGDSGFTVVGKGQFGTERGWDAFAAHFVPKPPADVIKAPVSSLNMPGVRCVVAGSRVVFSTSQQLKTPVGLTVYNAAGKVVAKMSNGGSQGRVFTWDYSMAAKGVYLYKVECDGHVFKGKVAAGK